MPFFNKSKTTVAGTSWAFLFCLCATALAQDHNLERISLKQFDSYYRISLHCDGQVTYASRFKKTPPTLILYLRDTVLKTSNKNIGYKGPVKKIEAAQWKTAPAIVKISIAFAGLVTYEIKNGTDGLIYIDFAENNNSHPLLHSKNSEVNSDGQPVSSSISEESPTINHDTFYNVPSPTASHGSSNAYHKSVSLKEEPSVRISNLLNSKELLSLDVREAEISNVLRLLAKQSNLNIIASRDVSGKVTVSLSNVTVKDALDNIVKANGYDYIIDNEVIVVKPRGKFQLEELETKVYRLNYIDANNLKSTLSQILSSEAKIQVFYHNFHPGEKKGDGQKTAKKSRSSTLIVTDAPANIKQLDAMIAALDVPTPQIMIEAKLIEVGPQKNEKLGIDWSKSIGAQIFQEALLPSGNPFRYSVELPLTGGSINYGTLTLDEYSAVLDFLSSHTKSKLVSNPRIMAMDNQEATISVGTTVPIPQINRGVGGQGDVVTFEYRDVNISLQVTPHVGDDETITLFVNPVIEEITGEVVAGDNRAPITSKREVETVVKLKSNETMVIGGLIKENTIETLDKVWLLGDVPLIGNFFRHKSKTKRQTDLLIFITPRLFKGS
ncbi:MAG: secretin N-terminal domain-containing protein [bacterium]